MPLTTFSPPPLSSDIRATPTKRGALSSQTYLAHRTLVASSWSSLNLNGKRERRSTMNGAHLLQLCGSINLRGRAKRGGQLGAAEAEAGAEGGGEAVLVSAWRRRDKKMTTNKPINLACSAQSKFTRRLVGAAPLASNWPLDIGQRRLDSGAQSGAARLLRSELEAQASERKLATTFQEAKWNRNNFD